MSSVDIEYDEDRGNTAVPECPLSISREEDFYKATDQVMGYDEPEDGDARFAIAPCIAFERLVRKAHVGNPSVFNASRLLPAVIHVARIAEAIEAFVEHGLLRDDCDDDDDATRVFATYDELLKACDAIIQQHPEEPRFQADDPNWFDVCEPFSAGAGVGSWVNDTMIDRVVRKTNDLSIYVELAELFGPRNLQGDRDDPSSQFAMMVGGADRGQLITTVRK